MDYNFKKFEAKNARLESRITVTKKSHSIGFPTKFYRDNGIKNFKYVVLYYDQPKKAVGIHFTSDEKEENTFVINHSDNYGASIVARSFLKSNNLDPSVYHGRYDWEKHNIDGVGEVFVINLKKKEITK
ncbi:hypothetical protein KKI23_01565 [Patescibacteria group bacterium]|nr:hypothetical protein [Patescibacteria group bacterium]